MKKIFFIALVVSSCTNSKKSHPKADIDNTPINIVQTCLDSIYRLDYQEYKKFRAKDSLMGTHTSDGYFDYQLILIKNKFFPSNSVLTWGKSLVIDNVDESEKAKLSFIRLDTVGYNSTHSFAQFFWITRSRLIKFKLSPVKNKWRITEIESASPDINKKSLSK
jgi:hypothetical protein